MLIESSNWSIACDIIMICESICAMDCMLVFANVGVDGCVTYPGTMQFHPCVCAMDPVVLDGDEYWIRPSVLPDKIFGDFIFAFLICIPVPIPQLQKFCF